MAHILDILWSITKGAWLTGGAILLFRLIFRRVLSPKAKYYLWLLLALRLLLPAVPESGLSLWNIFPQSSQEISQEVAPQPAPTGDTLSIETPTETVAIIPEKLPASESHLSGTTILFWGWLGGMGLVFLCYVLLYALTARQLRRLPYCTDSDTIRVFLGLKKALRIQKPVRLVLGGGGMLGGVFRPTLVLPPERHGEDVAPILVHELLHLKYRDLWLLLALRLLAAVHWYNPMVWLCLYLAKSDSEAACDQRVLESKLVRADCYAGALYQEGVMHMRPSPLLQTTFGGYRHSLKRRIRLIFRFRRPSTLVTALTLVMVVTITACTMTDAKVADTSSVAPISNQESTEESDLTADDLDEYLDNLQPDFGHFGWTFEQHVEAGLLDPANGTLELGNDAGTFQVFSTTLELNGDVLDAEYIFSVTQFTKNTTGRMVLTEIYAYLPDSLTDLDSWAETVMEPWSGQVYQNYALAQRYLTLATVGPYLTDAQRDTVAANVLAEDLVSTLDEGYQYVDNWVMFTTGYLPTENAWHFNGTGMALYLTAEDGT
jgi:bla regulator protein BlaR1